MAQTLQHAVYIARSILERAQCIVYERRSAGDGRTIHIYKQIAHTCLVYVGLAQARPNYIVAQFETLDTVGCHTASLSDIVLRTGSTDC